ncbi:MAG: hypothetical protein ACR2RB_19845 [Gammaproteobacteria bacterium]
MPILPENRERYPENWDAEIVPAIKRRAGNRCEGSPEYPDCRARHGEPHPVNGSKVVLTTGHLDHTPENCNPENLRSWCQRCHLAYDMQHHIETRRRRKAMADLFE